MSNEATAVIPVDNLSELQAQLDKLNKRAVKLSLEPITLRLGERSTREHPYYKGTFYEAVEVFVEGNAPTLAGWQFVATLEHDENGTLIRRIPTFTEEIDLSQYRTASPDHCDQCGYRRRRNDTYVVAYVGDDRDAEGVLENHFETKQVGSSCLKDFIGSENPQAIARFLQDVRDFIEGCGREGGFVGDRITPRYDLNDFMGTAAAVVRENGYVSRRKAEEEMREATADLVRSDYFNRLERKSFNGEQYWTTVTDADAELADKAIAWVQALTEKDLENDYLYNVFTVCKSGTLTDRQLGIAASAITAYQRAEGRRVERESAKQVDEFLAEPKEKVSVTFTVQQIFSDPTEYGMSHKHILKADTGHRLVWRTNAAPLEQGKQYSGVFSVKEQRESKYGRETWLWRPKDLQEV